jgi:hypothetical protein
LAIVLMCANLSLSVLGGVLNRNRNNSYEVDKEERMYASIIPWVKTNTASENVFMWSKPGLRYLLSQRKAADLLTTSDEKKILTTIEDAGVDYVVVDSFSHRTLLYLKPIIEKHPDRFSLTFKNGTSAIYKVAR